VSRRLCKALAALSFTFWVTSSASADAACRQALALGLDVSGSVDEAEYQLQLQGLAAALMSDDVRASLMRLPDAPVRILVFEWSGQDYQRVLIPWTDITSPSRLKAVSEQLQVHHPPPSPTNHRFGSSHTGRSWVSKPTARLLEAHLGYFRGMGKTTQGPEPHHVNGPEKIGDIVINALIIGVDATSRLSHAELSIAELTAYFAHRVLAGPDAFSEVAIGFDDYERAMSRKVTSRIGIFEHEPIGSINESNLFAPILLHPPQRCIDILDPGALQNPLRLQRSRMTLKRVIHKSTNMLPLIGQPHAHRPPVRPAPFMVHIAHTHQFFQIVTDI
jgi:hypothetical protein